MFCPFVVDCRNHANLERCFSVSRECKVADAIKVIKTLVNGWATSHRYHEEKLLPCVFGCSGCVDSLKHYMKCPALLAFRRFLACGVASEDPLIRRGLTNPSKDTSLLTSCIFSGYHAVRRDLCELGMFFEYTQLVLHLITFRGPGAYSLIPSRLKVGSWL